MPTVSSYTVSIGTRFVGSLTLIVRTPCPTFESGLYPATIAYVLVPMVNVLTPVAPIIVLLPAFRIMFDGSVTSYIRMEPVKSPDVTSAYILPPIVNVST